MIDDENESSAQFASGEEISINELGRVFRPICFRNEDLNVLLRAILKTMAKFFKFLNSISSWYVERLSQRVFARAFSEIMAEFLKFNEILKQPIARPTQPPTAHAANVGAAGRNVPFPQAARQGPVGRRS